MSYKTGKKYFDFILALILLFLFSIPIIIISLIIAIQTKQFPLYTQQRGQTLSKYCFKIYKFRTINSNHHIINDNNSILYKPQLKKFIFPFGRFLRKTGLDEIPQLLNVLKGDMSFVGPRPLSIEDLKQIKKYFPDEYKKRELLNIKPGITGFWQINKNLSDRISFLVEMDNYYCKEKSFTFDLFIIIKSIFILLKGQHKDSILSNKNTKALKSFRFKLVN